MERSGCPTRAGNWGGVSLQAQKFELPPLLLDITPTKTPCPFPDHRSHIKVSLMVFRQTLPKILPAACIFELHNHDLFEKARWN